MSIKENETNIELFADIKRIARTIRARIFLKNPKLLNYPKSDWPEDLAEISEIYNRALRGYALAVKSMQSPPIKTSDKESHEEPEPENSRDASQD